MVRAEKTDQDDFLFCFVASLAVCLAHVDCVLVIEALADGVSFNENVTHGDGW